MWSCTNGIRELIWFDFKSLVLKCASVTWITIFLISSQAKWKIKKSPARDEGYTQEELMDLFSKVIYS